MDFPTYHKYIELAAEGRCKPLICQYCKEPVQLVTGPRDVPALRCYNCNVLTIPGLSMYADIEAIVKEWTT